jgi:hypothetical protein
MRDQSRLTHFMKIWEDHQLRTLERYYPDWDISMIRGIGPSAWCARREGNPSALFITQSPEHLVRLMAESQFPAPGSGGDSAAL